MRWLSVLLVGALLAAPLFGRPAQSGASAKTPPPSPDTVASERTKLYERAKTPLDEPLSKSASAKLAARFLEEGRSAGAGSDVQFVALDAAWRCAVDGAEIELALDAIELLDVVFEIDARAHRVSALKALARNASGSKIKVVVSRALVFARQCIDLEEYEAALEILDDVKLRKFARDDPESQPLYDSLWTAEVQAFKTMREWLAKLETSPLDPQANHYAGYYYCFERRDFARGLEHLARSHLEAYKAIAASDANAPADAAGRLELAHSWVRFVEAELTKPRAKLAGSTRARHWLGAVRTSSPPPSAEQLAAAEELTAELDSADAKAQAARLPRPAGSSSASDLNRSRSRAKLPRESQAAVSAALEWLAQHQSDDGRWSCSGFSSECVAAGIERDGACGEAGEEAHDAGVTALALMALIEGGSDTEGGPHAEAVQRGVRWLIGKQDAGNGMLGERTGHGFMYSHAMATAVLARAQQLSPSDELSSALKRAVALILAARNPYSGWRYNETPSGDTDTSVTAWMVKALSAAEKAAIPFDPGAREGALTFIDEMTDVASGRVGYANTGSISARVPKVNDSFNASRGEALTGAGLTCRLLLGQTLASNTLVKRHGELLLRKLPAWSTDPAAEAGVDFYGWYYGSLAMRGLGEPFADPWFAALRSVLVEQQRTDGHAKGSWNAAGDPWGFAGGRVYATAMGALALLAEVDEALAPTARKK